MSIKGRRVAFLGAGNMGEALIKGLVQTGLVPTVSISASDARADRLADLAAQYGIHVLTEIAAAVDGSKLLISIAAGVATRKLREHLGKPARLIRVMPNTPALVLEGVTAIARAEGLEPGDLEAAQELFGAVGKVVVLDEGAMDAVTGLSGSGPAY